MAVHRVSRQVILSAGGLRASITIGGKKTEINVEKRDSTWKREKRCEIDVEERKDESKYYEARSADEWAEHISTI